MSAARKRGSTTTHLVPMGGGAGRGILRYFLKLTGKRFPKVCLIPTAMGDRRETVERFLYQFNPLGAHMDFLSLYHIPTRDLEAYVLDFDAVFVSGGNTRNLLALWREWGLDRILKKAWARGVVMGGGSAGGICWFEGGSTDSWPDEYNPLPAMGWLKGSFCPHYLGEKNRRETYHEMVGRGRLKAGYGVTDGAALHFADGKLAEAVVEDDKAGVFRVERDPRGRVVETRLSATLLEG